MPDEDEAPLCQGPNPHPRAPTISIPADACDCHAHIIGPLAMFPLRAERSYTPPEAPLGAYRQMLATLGLTRGVLVQPSVFGTDNSCMLQALARHRNTLRGVAVVDQNVDDETLETLSGNGVKGLRLNVLFKGGVPLEQIGALARRIEPLQWHLQFLIDARDLTALAPRLSDLPVDIVIDHMGHMPADAGIGHPGFKALLEMVKRGRCWVKMSGANRTSVQGPPYTDTIPFARALVDTDPTRLVWGSDWPHVAIEGPMSNDGEFLDLLGQWAPDERLRHLILVENPARLYGFEE